LGFVQYDAPVGSSHFSQAVPCPACGSSQQQARLDRLCGLPAEYKSLCLADTYRRPDMAAALDAIAALAAEPCWFLTLTGPVGVGKTHLLAVLVNEARAHGWPSVYLVMADLLGHLRMAYDPKAEATYDNLWERLLVARVLALDEFDSWNPTPWAQEKFFQLMDARYREGAHRLTAFATNADLDALPDKLTSRMRDRRCRVFHLAGADMRQVRP
jgi:DNA replication protein DnaC